jgi:hypothetical protein
MRSLACAVLLVSAVAFAEPPVTDPQPAAVDVKLDPQARANTFFWHRVTGIVSFGLQVAALSFTLLDHGARFSAVDTGSPQWRLSEILTASAAQAGFATTYLIAFLAPPRASTPTRNIVHQALVYASGAMNVARIILSIVLWNAVGSNSQPGVEATRVALAIGAPVLLAAGGILQYF